MSDEPKTVVEPERRFDPWRELSSRLAKVELSVIKQGDAIQQLNTQLLDYLLRNSRVTHDAATTALEKLDASIDEMDDKRDDLVRKIAACTDDRELFLLKMTLDNLQYRLERARGERDEALIRKQGSEDLVNDTNQKITNMGRPGKDMTLSFPAIQPAKEPSVPDRIAKWLSDKVLPDLVKFLIYFILAAVGYYIIAKINGTAP